MVSTKNKVYTQVDPKTGLNKVKKRPNVQRGLFIAGTLFIPLLSFCIFYIYVNLDSFAMSFQRYDVHEKLYWTLENFSGVFESFTQSGGEGFIALRNTALWFLLALASTMTVAIIWSYFSYKNVWLDTVNRILRAGVGLMPNVILFIFTYPLFQSDAFGTPAATGPISKIVSWMTGQEIPIPVLHNSDTANWGYLLFTVWFSFGMNYYIRGAMMRIPDDVIEYASLDGVTWLQEIRFIILPMIWPTMVTLLTLQFCGFLNSGPAADVFLYNEGGYGTLTLSVWLFKLQLGADVKSNSLHFLAALGNSLTFVFMPIVFTVKHFLEKLQEVVEF